MRRIIDHIVTAPPCLGTAAGFLFINVFANTAKRETCAEEAEYHRFCGATDLIADDGTRKPAKAHVHKAYTVTGRGVASLCAHAEGRQLCRYGRGQ
jgi:hypothetical protein